MTSRNYQSIRRVRQSIDYDLDQWAASRETSLATVDAGKIDDGGQWIGDEDDVLAAATAGDFPLVQADGLPVYVDGTLVREG